jgi:hypothetical protein
MTCLAGMVRKLLQPVDESELTCHLTRLTCHLYVRWMHGPLLILHTFQQGQTGDSQGGGGEVGAQGFCHCHVIQMPLTCHA